LILKNASWSYQLDAVAFPLETTLFLRIVHNGIALSLHSEIPCLHLTALVGDMDFNLPADFEGVVISVKHVGIVAVVEGIRIEANTIHV